MQLTPPGATSQRLKLFVLMLLWMQLRLISSSISDGQQGKQQQQQHKQQQQQQQQQQQNAPQNSKTAMSSSKRSKITSPLQCSRAHSRFVREYFARALLPIYQKYSLPVPEKCPFSPVFDIYHYHENNKSKLDLNKWKCEICGKLFVSESYLDKHYDNRHASSLQLNENTLCLANHCRIFRCEVLMNPNAKSGGKCYESTMMTLRNKCLAQLDACIPHAGSIRNRNQLTVELRENLCNFLTCAKYYTFPTYMSNGPSFLTIFLVVAIICVCLIIYGVLNHTDLIYDENEVVNSNQDEGIASDSAMFNNIRGGVKPSSSVSSGGSAHKSTGGVNASLNKAANFLRHRHVPSCSVNSKTS